MAWRGRGLPRDDQSRVPGSAWRTTSDAVSSFSLVGAMSHANRVATLGSGMERNGRWPASPVPSPVTTTPWFTIQPEAAWCCKEVITGRSRSKTPGCGMIANGPTFLLKAPGHAMPISLSTIAPVPESSFLAECIWTAAELLFSPTRGLGTVSGRCSTRGVGMVAPITP